MKRIEAPDIHYLIAAEGWLGLGDLASASDELDQITPALREHPSVLVVRCDIFAEAKNWNSLLQVASTRIRIAPEDPNSWLNCSFALQQMRRIADAFDLLLPTVEKFPKNWMVTYNLACYTAQLGRLNEAWRWLEKTIKIRDPKKLKLEALDDPDLEPLWPAIARIPTDMPPTPANSEPCWPRRFAPN